MSFNTINIGIFGIPPYFFCTVVGFVVAICLNIVLIYIKGYCLQENMKVLIISIIGMLISAKLFGYISGVYRAIGSGETITFDTVKNTGIVFYGGLLGLLLSFHLCTKTKLITDKDSHYIDILAVCIPLFHSIARIGCFLAGCCYGIESNDISITYTIMKADALNTANRIPVQLIESFFNFGIFIYLLVLVRDREWKSKKILVRYLIIYSCGRFLLEFIRGDMNRGVIMGVSFSQVISVLIWLTIIITLVRKHKAKENGV